MNQSDQEVREMSEDKNLEMAVKQWCYALHRSALTARREGLQASYGMVLKNIPWTEIAEWIKEEPGVHGTMLALLESGDAQMADLIGERDALRQERDDAQKEREMLRDQLHEANDTRNIIADTLIDERDKAKKEENCLRESLRKFRDERDSLLEQRNAALVAKHVAENDALDETAALRERMAELESTVQDIVHHRTPDGSCSLSQYLGLAQRVDRQYAGLAQRVTVIENRYKLQHEAWEQVKCQYPLLEAVLFPGEFGVITADARIIDSAQEYAEDVSRTAKSQAEPEEEEIPDQLPPPCDIQAEQAVLGVLLRDNGALDLAVMDAAPGLQASDFYRLEHRLIFESIGRVGSRGEVADAVTVADDLRQREIPDDEWGGIGYLVMLAQDVPNSSNALAYARIVKRYAEERRRILDLVDVDLVDAGDDRDSLDWLLDDEATDR